MPGAAESSLPNLLLRRGLTSMKDLDQAQAFVTKAGLFGHGSLVASLVAWASLSPSGCLARARSLFEETAMDDPLVCNAMVRAYAVSVFPVRAFWVFNRMQRLGVGCDGFALSFALRACARALRWSEVEDRTEIENKGFEIHCRALKLGFCRDRCVEDSLLLAYSKCRCVKLARELFDEMPERRVGSWNVMISAYNRVGDFESADRVFGSMPRKSVVAWNTLLSRQVGSGKIGDARRLFDEMPERDSVSWNTMISGHVRGKDYAGALRLFREMGPAGAEATEITLVSVLGACAETGSLEIGRQIHGSLKHEGTRIEGYLGNALVDMYAKCGDLKSAREVFDGLKIRPTSCWNAMIMGLTIHGRSEEALDLFSEMEKRPDEEVRPNRVTFIGVLTACSHKGLVEEGRRYLNTMIERYRIAPDEKHYGCMVDLLSRFGSLDEAYRTVMTVSPAMSSVLWRTLLGACSVHGRVDLAEECFRRLAELAPLADADYVLLSNVYAGAGRWDEVERLRNAMVSTGIPKLLGYSHYRDEINKNQK